VPLVPELVLHRLTGDLLEHWERIGSLPYWGHPWPGGQGLARYLLQHPATVAGRRVLDLASGSGLVALAASRAGAAEVIAADVDPLALAAIALNASANRARVQLCGRDLLTDPTDPTARTPAGGAPTDPADPASGWDVVLAGDVCYQAGLARRLTAFGRRAAVAGALVLLGDPGRHYLPEHGLRPLARFRVPTPEGLEASSEVGVTVWQLLAS
jgi:predicted nicotinamide N-methyase